MVQMFGQNVGEIIHQFSEVPFTKPIGSGVVVTNHVSYGFSTKKATVGHASLMRNAPARPLSSTILHDSERDFP